MSTETYLTEQAQSLYNNNCPSSGDFDILDFLGGDEDDEGDEANQNLPTNQIDPTLMNTGKVNQEENEEEDMPSMTLSITNVVAMANMRCHLRLKDIAKTSINVEYKALQNHVIMRLRKPYTVATIWSSGKIWCTGANSLKRARIGARRIARRISKCGFSCKFNNYRVVNIMATTKLPFRVRLDHLVEEAPRNMNYEPELAPGLNFKMNIHGSTSLKLFATGRMVIMGQSMDSIQEIVSKLVPMAAKHQTDEPVSEDEDEYYYRNKKHNRSKRKYRRNELSDEEQFDENDNDHSDAGSEGGAHMRYWSSRRALKDAKKTTLPHLPKEVIAAELDNDYYVDYDDEDNSDLEGIRGDGEDSDAEEAALMQRRIMRGENLDDYDSSDEENGVGNRLTASEKGIVSEVQLMSSDEEDEETDPEAKRHLKKDPSSIEAGLQDDLMKVEQYSEMQRKRELQRRQAQSELAKLRVPPLGPSKIRIFSAQPVKQAGRTPLKSTELDLTAARSSNKTARITSFNESSPNSSVLPTNVQSTKSSVLPSARFVSATPSILPVSQPNAVKRIVNPPGSVVRVVTPASNQQIHYSLPLPTATNPPVVASVIQQQPGTKFITINRLPTSSVGSPNVMCIAQNRSSIVSQMPVLRPAGSTTNPMIIVRPRMSKPQR